MCKNLAEWTITYGRAPDDVTEACTAHVGELLADEVEEQRVYPISLDRGVDAPPAVCCFMGVPDLIHENGVLLGRDPNGRVVEIRSGGQWVYVDEVPK